jgi:hypothetical protein
MPGLLGPLGNGIRGQVLLGSLPTPSSWPSDSRDDESRTA